MRERTADGAGPTDQDQVLLSIGAEAGARLTGAAGLRSMAWIDFLRARGEDFRAHRHRAGAPGHAGGEPGAAFRQCGRGADAGADLNADAAALSWRTGQTAILSAG